MAPPRIYLARCTRGAVVSVTLLPGKYVTLCGPRPMTFAPSPLSICYLLLIATLQLFSIVMVSFEMLI